MTVGTHKWKRMHYPHQPGAMLMAMLLWHTHNDYSNDMQLTADSTVDVLWQAVQICHHERLCQN